MAEVFDAWIQSVLEEYWATYQQMIEGYPAGFGVPAFEEYVNTRALAAATAGRPQPTPSQIDQFVANKMIGEVSAAKKEPAPTGKAEIPLPPGFEETWTDADGTIWRWDSGQGQYIRTGFDPTTVYQPPKPSMVRAEQVPDMPGYYRIHYSDGSVSDPILDKTYQPPEKPPTKYPRAEGQPETWTDDKGIIWVWDDDKNDYIQSGYDPTKDQSKQPKPPTTYPQVGQDPYGGQGWWNPYTGQWEAPPGWISPAEQARLAQTRQESQERGAWQQQQMAWWQQEAKMREDEQRRQMTAQLAANPRSWLEYASYTGTTPTVQPWMLPLMPQQYGLKTGEPIPGYSPQGMGGMPSLTPPSTQLWARMGPTAQQQLLGYGTARTGQTPEEQTWRLWSQAPPGGAFGGLQWQR